MPVKVVVFNNSVWGLVHVEMEAAGLPAFKGAGFPNMDFAAFARGMPRRGFIARCPMSWKPPIRQWLAPPARPFLTSSSPRRLRACHIAFEQVWKFGIARVREAWARVDVTIVRLHCLHESAWL